MPLVPLEIQPGVYRNGTEYQAKNRWYETNLVRWRDGKLEPVGGWTAFEDASLDGVARGALTWRDNTSTKFLTLGTSEKLYASQGGQFYDISPTGLLAGKADAIPSFGWGAGAYGTGDYGTKRETSILLDATTWSVDNWGEYLVACSITDGKLYEWQLRFTPGETLIENGTFDADTDWTKGTGWTIGSGVASFSGSTIEGLTQTISGLVVNKTYRITFTATDVGTDEARVKFTTGSDLVDQACVSGANTIEFTADATSGDITFEPFAAVASAFSIDDVVVQEMQYARQIPNAPEDNVGLIVTNERYLVALGAGGNKRKVQWSTQEDNTTWTPVVTNTAGDLELETAGRIRCAKRVGNDILIWTDVDVHLMRYVGPPFVYGIERIATGCGVVGPNAVVVAGNTAFWLSESGFWQYNGAIGALRCDALLDVTDNINRTQQAKVFGAHNSEFGEAWWFYPSLNSTENDKYIFFDYRMQHWSVGSMSRTSWADQGVFDEPFATDANGNVYQHETGWTADGATRVGDVYAETGPIEIGQGERFAVVNRIIADEYAQLPTVKATITAKKTPQDTGTSAEYTFDQADGYVDTRINARQIQVKLEAVEDDGFKFGTLRMDVRQGSKR